MANRLVIVVSDTNATITNLIEKTFSDSAGTTVSLSRIVDYISSIQCGAQTGATVQVTVRDTDPSVGTSGSGSVQVTLSKL
jgi:hypothetical protein